MLEELHIRNFAIIDNLELNFAPGLNVITGETGAGKSIIIDAVELILGGKADSSFIRAGADRTSIEGIFTLSGLARGLLLTVLEREELDSEEGDDSITLFREVRKTGRSIARVNGVTVNLDVLREIGDILVDIHGQSEHLSLLNSKTHLDLLDRYADLLEVREALATLVRNLNDVRREIKSLQEDEAAIQRRADQLGRDVEEIEAADIRPGEDDELRAERKRLSNSEQLATLATNIATLLNGDDNVADDEPAVDKLMAVSSYLDKLAAIDSDLEEWREVAESIATQAQELAIEMAGYADTVEYSPERLDEVEERLELISKLRRRYGATIEAVLEYAERAAEELEGIENSEERLEELHAKEIDLLQHIGEMSQKISQVRVRTGRQLARRVIAELKDLRMDRAAFEVSIEHIEDASGCYVGEKRLAFDSTGIDKVRLMLSANPGEPLRPLEKVASGGEAARIMLALKRVLTLADQTPTLIFDEVDQGIGGRIGAVVGEKLWGLTGSHQVLVVTHMPQLAVFADEHYHVRKSATNDHTATEVIVLDEPKRINEIAEMLGAQGDSGKQSARELLDAARIKKHENKEPDGEASSEQSGQKTLL